MKCKWILDGERHGMPHIKCARNGCVWEGTVKRWPMPVVGPSCVGTPERHELGAWAEIILGVFKINKAGYLWLKTRLGLQPKCGCEQRQDWLNRLGQRIASWLAYVTGWCKRSAGSSTTTTSTNVESTAVAVGTAESPTSPKNAAGNNH